MSDRRYYSVRTGKNEGGVHLTEDMLRRMFLATFTKFDGTHYFQEAFGYQCVDAGDVAGSLGVDIEAQMLLLLRKGGLWPIPVNGPEYSVDDVFDVIEFLYDHVSKPVAGTFHSFSGCGWHYRTFDKEAGAEEFRSEVNRFLRDFGDGFELSPAGEILATIPDGFASLTAMSLPVEAKTPAIEGRVREAVRKFQKARGHVTELRDAVRELADVLEYLRPQMAKKLTKKDDADLFNIINGFDVRHHNQRQQGDYDKPAWLRWMFFTFLATIEACLHIVDNEPESP